MAANDSKVSVNNKEAMDLEESSSPSRSSPLGSARSPVAAVHSPLVGEGNLSSASESSSQFSMDSDSSPPGAEDEAAVPVPTDEASETTAGVAADDVDMAMVIVAPEQ